MEPEISHRCPSCGASIRSHAQFCPQCGKVLKSSSSDSLPASETSDSLRRLRAERDLKTTPLPSISKVVEPTQALAPNAEEQAMPDASDGHPEPSKQTVVAAQDESLSKRQRVKDAARGVVKENVRPRVEKLRQASSVMLEEAAAIDPSLRFILIALLLFIIFVGMLFLSFIK